MNDGARVFVGPAGWSYDDWDEIVYRRGLGKQRLPAVARLFPVIEINSTFYRSPSPRSAESWRDAVADLDGFRFTAKLVRLFTHDDPKTWTLKGRDDFRDGVEPLREAGRLGALLVQFPFYYDATDDNLHRLSRIRKAFPQHELVLEVRHRSWLETANLERISSLGYSFCNADQPLAQESIPVGEVVTGPVGYLRLHGRNAEKWFQKGAPVHEKYDYLYSEQELDRMAEIAQKLIEKTDQLYVVANNHFAGQGPANALEMQYALTGRKVSAPQTLVEKYPRLASIVE